MENDAITPGAAGPAEGPTPLSFVERVGAVYFEPTRAFADITRRPTWLVVYLITCLLAVSSSWVMTQRMDPELMFQKGLEMNPFAKNLTEEQLQAARAQQNSTFAKVSRWVGAPIAILVFYVVIASVFLLVFMLMGASPGFKKSLAVTAWGFFPGGLVAGILGIVFMYVKDPEALSLNPSDNLASNLGLLVGKEHAVLKSLLGSIDIFSFWSIALLAIGYAAASGERKLTPGKAAVGIVAMWALWVLGKAGFAALFSS
jgi:hypothetical protein